MCSLTRYQRTFLPKSRKEEETDHHRPQIIGMSHPGQNGCFIEDSFRAVQYVDSAGQLIEKMATRSPSFKVERDLIDTKAGASFFDKFFNGEKKSLLDPDDDSFSISVLQFPYFGSGTLPSSAAPGNSQRENGLQEECSLRMEEDQKGRATLPPFGNSVWKRIKSSVGQFCMIPFGKDIRFSLFGNST